MTASFCVRCGRKLVDSAAYCAGCGASTAREPQAAGPRVGAGRREVERSVAALAAAFGGVLATLVVSARLSAAFDSRALNLLVMESGLLGSALLGVMLQGGDAWQRSLAAPAGPRALLAGAAGGLVGLALNLAWVSLLRASLGSPAQALESATPLFVVLMTGAVLPALVEEWLCRGVLWQSLRRLTGTRTTLILSALLFALLHMLGGGLWLEVPHRFAFGLILGLLRSRTGSLGPCVVAHGLNNVLALVLAAAG